MGFSVLLRKENKETAWKLGIATGLMFTLPFIALFVGYRVFDHKEYPENWAGLCAVLTANVVIAGYCYAAYIEDRDENDEDGPKTGAAKQRVD